MSVVRVTKQFTFEMAHALWNYDGPCRNIHGHSYRLFITVKGEPLNDPVKYKHGMIIDFGDLKKIVNMHIVDKYDHALVFSELVPTDSLSKIDQMFSKVYAVPFQPTCENLVVEFAEILSDKLPEKVSLVGIKLYETATSYAEWLAEDNIS